MTAIIIEDKKKDSTFFIIKGKIMRITPDCGFTIREERGDSAFYIHPDYIDNFKQYFNLDSLYKDIKFKAYYVEYKRYKGDSFLTYGPVLVDIIEEK
jgi:hypothetical protein